MKRLAEFIALPAAERRLLVEAFFTLLWVRLALRLWTIERLRRWAGRMGSPGVPAKRVVWAVCAAARRLPGTMCLSSALAAQRMLSRHGHESEVHVGVAKDDGRLAAHAWVVHDGRIVLDSEDHGSYTQLIAWPAARDGGEPPDGGLRRV